MQAGRWDRRKHGHLGWMKARAYVCAVPLRDVSKRVPVMSSEGLHWSLLVLSIVVIVPKLKSLPQAPGLVVKAGRVHCLGHL